MGGEKEEKACIWVPRQMSKMELILGFNRKIKKKTWNIVAHVKRSLDTWLTNVTNAFSISFIILKGIFKYVQSMVSIQKCPFLKFSTELSIMPLMKKMKQFILSRISRSNFYEKLH